MESGAKRRLRSEGEAVKSGKALSGKQQIQTWANLGIKDT